MKALWISVVLVGLSGAAIGCGESSTGHTEDKTPGGTPTPAPAQLMDQKAMEEYSKKQATNPG